MQLVREDNPTVFTDLLKIWLRELSDPIIPHRMYNEFVELYRQPADAIALCKAKLAEAHLETLEFLMRWLRKVASHVAVTSMSADNLAIVFAPNLLQMDEAAGIITPEMRLRNSEKEIVWVKVGACKHVQAGGRSVRVCSERDQQLAVIRRRSRVTCTHCSRSTAHKWPFWSSARVQLGPQ